MGAGLGEERTWNIPYMLVTLEVSKLSGWLNADALCRVSKGGRTVRGEVWDGKREGRGQRRRSKRAGEGAAADWWQATGRGARRT